MSNSKSFFTEISKDDFDRIWDLLEPGERYMDMKALNADGGVMRNLSFKINSGLNIVLACPDFIMMDGDDEQ